MKEIHEIFPKKWELRAFKKFQREGGGGLNTTQQVIAYLRYYNENIRGKYYRHGSGRRAIAKRIGVPEYKVKIILISFTIPDGSIPTINSKYEF